MIRYLAFLSLLICSSCFNERNKNVETEPIGVCGNATSPGNQAPTIFKAKCATCHHFDKDGTGPKMNRILDRVPSEEWLRAFITNQDSLVKAKDEHALEVMNLKPTDWDHNYSDLQQNDLDTLMGYITQ